MFKCAFVFTVMTVTLRNKCVRFSWNCSFYSQFLKKKKNMYLMALVLRFALVLVACVYA